MEKENLRTLIRNFAAELVLYSALVVAYSAVVLRWLSGPLRRLFSSNLLVYALVSLGLIVAQGALLDVLTTFLLDQLPIGRPE